MSALIRLTPEGTADPSFGEGGLRWLDEHTTDMATDGCHIAVCAPSGPQLFRMDGQRVTWPTDAACDRVAMDRAGRVLVAGPAPGPTGFRVARFHPDGTLDSSFADQGVWEASVDDPIDAEIRALAATPGDGFLALGLHGSPPALVVLQADETGNAISGWERPVTVPLQQGRNWRAHRIRGAFQDDADNVLVHTTDHLVRLTSAGEVDADFADGGALDLQPEPWGGDVNVIHWGPLVYDPAGRRYVFAHGAVYDTPWVVRYWQ